jgi:hypothetical protein
MSKTALEIRVTPEVTVDNFAEALASGKVQLYTVRGNGTTRHIPFYAEGTADREVAEQVAEWREDGRTMKSIADELHLSVPSVRRMLNSLYLSEDVESYDEEDIASVLADASEGEPVVGEVVAPSEEADAAASKCEDCGDQILEGTTHCPECFGKHHTVVVS